MISSRNRALAAGALAALLAGIGGIHGVAHAQSTVAAQPAVDAPRAAAPDALPAAAEQPSEQGFVNPFAPVQSQALGQVEADLVGVINQQSGGFPENMWAGTDRLVVETVLPQLTVDPTSPAMMDLARRLLLTRAQAPQGVTHGGSVVGARLDRALTIGQVGAVETMAQQAPAELDTPAALGPRADALLYQGNDADACVLAERARGHANDTAWTERLAFCSALAHKVAEARLGVDVLSDSGDADHAFVELMAKWLDKSPVKSVKIASPNAVHFALLRHTDVALDESSLRNASAAFLVAWAADGKAPLAQRLAAAERSACTGAVPAVTLLGLYRQVKLKDALLAKPFDAKLMPAGPTGIAYIVQKYEQTKDSTVRAQLIAAAFASAKKRGVLPAASVVFGAALGTVVPKPELLDVASAFAAGAAMSGNGTGVRPWFDLLRAQGAGDSEAALALRSLLTVRGDATDVAWSATDFAARLDGAAPDDRPRALLEWTLMRALGTPGSDAIRISALGGPFSATAPAPLPAIVDALKDAALHKRLGETVMFSLMALGSGGPRLAHPETLDLVTAALAHVGLTNEARAIAAEALVWRLP
jgi:hypothetical protein